MMSAWGHISPTFATGKKISDGLGAEWMLSENVKLFGHLERENGSKYTKELDFNVGLKYMF